MKDKNTTPSEQFLHVIKKVYRNRGKVKDFIDLKSKIWIVIKHNTK